jgi:hypothetical protein
VSSADCSAGYSAGSSAVALRQGFGTTTDSCLHMAAQAAVAERAHTSLAGGHATYNKELGYL